MCVHLSASSCHKLCCLPQPTVCLQTPVPRVTSILRAASDDAALFANKYRCKEARQQTFVDPDFSMPSLLLPEFVARISLAAEVQVALASVTGLDAMGGVSLVPKAV